MTSEGTVKIKIRFLAKDNIQFESKNYRKELKKIKIPKEGFFTKRSKHEEICHLKRKKQVYEKLVDMCGMIERLDGIISKKEIFYDQGKNKNGNWALFTIQFKDANRKKEFKETYFELYPDCEVSDETDV